MPRTLRTAALAILLVSFGAIAFADSHEDTNVYVWVNFVKAKPGQGDALIGFMMEEDSKNFDPLVESGAALEWGIAMPVVHDGNDPFSHVEWITFVGWEGVDTFMTDFMASRQAMSPEDMQALNERYQATVVAGSHADMINRNVHLGAGAPARPGYIHLGYWKAKPGKESDAMKAFKSFAAPVYDGLVADGKIQNYGLHVPAVHRNSGWTHMGWYASESLAARDVVDAAFEAAGAARSEEEQKQMQSDMMEIFAEWHEDQILMVVHHKAGSAGGD